MPSKSDINKAFNKLFFDFLDDIVSIYPDNKDISSARTSFASFKQMNPTIIIKSWFKFVYTPYREVINAGDISFFFNKDYSADLQDTPGSKEIMRVIDEIRGPIQSMDETNKKHSSDYILKLSKLSELYGNM
tara:strand:- start:8221 stop:8616 length:396 start_codon:yes stop_codon:yes gene_type:complete